MKTISRKICKANCIVKRHGHVESFDERKAYASCYAACVSCHMQKELAEKISSKISGEVKAWVKTKHSVTSTQIFKRVASALRKYNKDAAFMYSTHRDIS